MTDTTVTENMDIDDILGIPGETRIFGDAAISGVESAILFSVDLYSIAFETPWQSKIDATCLKGLLNYLGKTKNSGKMGRRTTKSKVVIAISKGENGKPHT